MKVLSLKVAIAQASMLTFKFKGGNIYINIYKIYIFFKTLTCDPNKPKLVFCFVLLQVTQ